MTIRRQPLKWGHDLRSGYTLPTPVLLDAFDTDTGYTLVGGTGASKVLDTSNKVEGAGSMSLTGQAASVTVGLDKTYGSVDPPALGVLAFYADRITAGSVTQVALALHRGSATGNVNFINEAQFMRGGRWLAAHISEWPTVMAAGVGALRTRELINQASPFSPQMRLDALYYNAKGRPTVVLTFDDATASIINVAYPLMAVRGIKGTCYIPNALIGRANRLTLANLQTLYAAGWDMGCDSTDDSAFTAMADAAAALADVKTVRTYLTDNGMPRGVNHVCWPFGSKSEAIAAAFREDATPFLTIRNTEPQSFFSRFGIGEGTRRSLPSCGFSPSTAGSVATARLTEIKRRGTTQFFHFHDIADSPSGIGWQTSKFVAFLDELKRASNANEIDILTVSEFWARDGAATAP